MTRAAALAALLAACRRDAAVPPPPVVAPEAGVMLDAPACASGLELGMMLTGPIDAVRTAKKLPADAAPELVEDRCNKRVMRFGGERIVAFVDPRTGQVTSIASPDVPKPPGCLDSRIAAAAEIVPYGRALIDEARAGAGSAWLDSDIGALRFVDCAAPDASDDADTLLHELDHGLRHEDCLHDPDGGPLCFVQMAGLPPRRLARLDALPLANGPARATFQSIHDVYLVSEGGSPAVLLFDELLAYSISLDVQTARAMRHASPRRPAIMPMFAYLTLHYLELVRADHPDLVRANRAAFARLFARVDATWGAWLTVRGPASEFTAAEDAWWKLAGALRPTVLAP